MSQKAITIYTPSGSAPHISADDDAFIHHSLLGKRSGMLGGLTCTKVDNNTVRLEGGGASNLGYILRVPDGECCDLTIDNGKSGTNRIDVIASRFKKGGADVADTHQFVVIKGTSAASPTIPYLAFSQLRSAGDINEIPLFHVNITGTTISSISPFSDDAALSVTAKKFATPVNITLAGDVQGEAVLDGSSDVTIRTDAPALVALSSYRLSLSATETDPVALVKSQWSKFEAGKAFIVYVTKTNSNATYVFIGDKTSETFGCMLMLSFTLTAPTWHYMRSGVWSTATLGTK